jgi:hypothetical protein
MQSDLIVHAYGCTIRLRNVGEELWADNAFVQLATTVVRRVNGLYQADYAKGTAAWFDTPDEAVSAAMRDAEVQPGRDLNQIKQMTLMGLDKEAAE